MKKLIYGLKIFLLTILFTLGLANNCFAYLPGYVSPVEIFINTFGKIILIFEIILAIAFVISLICMIIGKLRNSNGLLSKSKKVCENLFYYFIFVIFLTIDIFILTTWNNWLIPLISLVPLILSILSLFFRLKNNDKAISYFILAINVVLYLIYVFLSNYTLIYFVTKS